MKRRGLFRMILDDHRDVVVLKHAIHVYACLLNMDDFTYLSFDDPLLDDIAHKINELKQKVKEFKTENE